MKKFRFGENSNYEYKGFGIFDSDANAFLASKNGNVVIYDKKKNAQYAIDAQIETAFPYRKAATSIIA
jgi:hypothetical protein